jgi:F0F1-type ATP synthase assembly protein I
MLFPQSGCYCPASTESTVQHISSALSFGPDLTSGDERAARVSKTIARFKLSDVSASGWAGAGSRCRNALLARPWKGKVEIVVGVVVGLVVGVVVGFAVVVVDKMLPSSAVAKEGKAHHNQHFSFPHSLTLQE